MPSLRKFTKRAGGVYLIATPHLAGAKRALWVAKRGAKPTRDQTVYVSPAMYSLLSLADSDEERRRVSRSIRIKRVGQRQFEAIILGTDGG